MYCGKQFHQVSELYLAYIRNLMIMVIVTVSLLQCTGLAERLSEMLHFSTSSATVTDRHYKY